MLTREQEQKLETKQAIEYFCFKRFAKWQNESKQLFGFISFGDSNRDEPDILAAYQDEKVGIEIATIYGGKYNAARLLGRINEEDYRDELNYECLVSLDRVHLELQKRIEDKQNKTYSMNRPYLVIQNSFPLFDKDDFLFHEGIYDCGQFRQIWLLCDVAGESGIIRLDKNDSNF